MREGKRVMQLVKHRAQGYQLAGYEMSLICSITSSRSESVSCSFDFNAPPALKKMALTGQRQMMHTM
jgi:hypothetical protein